MAYIEPTPAALKAYYPAFAAVSDATVQVYITRVIGLDVDQSWSEAAYAPAIIAAAAHRMVRNGVLASGEDIGGIAATGLTTFKSGTFSASFSEAAIKAVIEGGWASTSYGLDYYELLLMKASGPRVTAPGCMPGGYGFNGFAGPLPYPAAMYE